jgi:WD40 repeat protein
LWKVESGEQQKTFVGHSGLVTSVAYSPDGRFLASCGRDRFIKIWEVASGKCLKSLGSDDFFTSSAVKFGLDNKQVYLGGESLQLWDIDAGKCLRLFEGHSDSVGAIAISRNGKWIASAGDYTDRTVRLWEVKSGNCLWKKDLTEQVGGAWSLVFASEDNVLLSGHHDGGIRYWDVKSGKDLRTVKAHSGVVSSLSADPKGQYLASGSWDKCIKLWKVSLGGSAGR